MAKTIIRKGVNDLKSVEKAEYLALNDKLICENKALFDECEALKENLDIINQKLRKSNAIMENIKVAITHARDIEIKCLLEDGSISAIKLLDRAPCALSAAANSCGGSKNMSDGDAANLIEIMLKVFRNMARDYENLLFKYTKVLTSENHGNQAALIYFVLSNVFFDITRAAESHGRGKHIDYYSALDFIRSHMCAWFEELRWESVSLWEDSILDRNMHTVIADIIKKLEDKIAKKRLDSKENDVCQDDD